MEASAAPSVADRVASAGPEPAPRALRILVVNWMDPAHPAAGGAERHLLEVFGRLVQRGHAVTLLATRFPGGPAIDSVHGMRVLRAGGRFTFPWRAFRVLRRLLASQTFDVVVEDLNKVPLPLSRLPAPRVVLVHHLWGRVAFGAANAAVAAATVMLERLVPRLARGARVVAVSDSTRHDLVRLGLPRDAVTVIRNGADPAPATSSMPVARAAQPLFVYLGRLQRYKRVDLIVRAARRLLDEGRRFQVIIAGDGPDRRRIERLAARLRVTTAVDIAGYVDEARKAELLRSAWANLLMSAKEGWGLTVLEAASAGTCSVVAFAPGLWDAVTHLETGLWIPYHHLPTLADGLRYLIENPDAVERMGRAAARRASARTWDAVATDLERCLAATVASRR